MAVPTPLLLGAWARLAPLSELRLEHTLANGQSFAWSTCSAPGAPPAFTGVVGSTVVSLRERGGAVEVAAWGAAAAPPPPPLLRALRDYFQLHVPLAPLYAAWGAADARMATIAGVLPGVRLLRQPPFECAISFLCSSNNNIGRIAGMLSRLRSTYGVPLGSTPCVLEGADDAHAQQQHFSFPTVAALAAAPESALRGLGMGYRAKFISGSAAKVLAQGGEDYLLSLRPPPMGADVDAPTAAAAAATARGAAVRALLNLPGVGPKVADCIALFSLDCGDAVPVDTHVWTIACRDFDGSLAAAKSLTPSVYARVGDLFRGRYGVRAGWAHSLLFTGELPAFRARLPVSMAEEMSAHRVAERAAKAEKREAAKSRKREREAGAAEGEGAGGVSCGVAEGGAPVSPPPSMPPPRRRRKADMPSRA